MDKLVVGGLYRCYEPVVNSVGSLNEGDVIKVLSVGQLNYCEIVRGEKVGNKIRILFPDGCIRVDAYETAIRAALVELEKVQDATVDETIQATSAILTAALPDDAPALDDATTLQPDAHPNQLLRGFFRR